MKILNKKIFSFSFIIYFFLLQQNIAYALDISRHNSDDSKSFDYIMVDESYAGLTGLKNFISKKKNVTGNFNQEKTLTDMDITLKSNGNFYFKQNIGIIWNITTPLKATYIITKEFFCSKIQNKLDKKIFSKEPYFQEVKESVEVILNNNYSSLFKNFNVYKKKYKKDTINKPKICPINTCTTITLVPKNKKISDFIDNIYLYLTDTKPSSQLTAKLFLNIYYKNGDKINLELASNNPTKQEITNENFICK